MRHLRGQGRRHWLLGPSGGGLMQLPRVWIPRSNFSGSRLALFVSTPSGSHQRDGRVQLGAWAAADCGPFAHLLQHSSHWAGASALLPVRLVAVLLALSFGPCGSE
jgi:hypothetical protein